MKIFENRNYNVKGRVLPIDSFRFIREAKELTFNTKSAEMREVMKYADMALSQEIPPLPLSAS